MSETATAEVIGPRNPKAQPRNLSELRDDIARYDPKFRADGPHPVQTSDTAFTGWMIESQRPGYRVKRIARRIAHYIRRFNK